MGFLRNVKCNEMAIQARKAIEAGRRVFAAKLNYPATKADFSGEIVDWSEMIDTIEGEGWTLQNFTGSSDSKGRPEALCLFRRI